MELKNAVAICLISLFSATLVVLIARSLDSQAASQLEPQLARIVEELEAIRKQGGGPAGTGSTTQVDAVDDGLVVYYFHSNTRCPTCQAIESQAHETVQADFAAPLQHGEIQWKTLNYEKPAAGALAKQFDIQMPVVVLAKMQAGRMQTWKRLDEVWALVNDKEAFAKYIRDEIRSLFETEPSSPAASDASSAAGVAPADLPIPSPAADPPADK
jgi:hypothetical protein